MGWRGVAKAITRNLFSVFFSIFYLAILFLNVDSLGILEKNVLPISFEVGLLKLFHYSIRAVFTQLIFFRLWT